MKKVYTDPIIQHIASRITSYRFEHDLTQEELASEAGIHRNYLGYIEKGSINIGMIALERIAFAMHMTPADLLDGYDPMEDE